MKYRLLIGYLLLSLGTGCGIGDESPNPGPTDSTVVDGVSPIVIAVTPATGQVGDTITIQGLGFSAAAPNNIIIIGNSSTTAATWNIISNSTNGSDSELTFQIPAGTTAGAADITVNVFQLTSNTLTGQFTVLP